MTARNAYNLKEEAVVRKETTIQRKLVEAFIEISETWETGKTYLTPS